MRLSFSFGLWGSIQPHTLISPSETYHVFYDRVSVYTPRESRKSGKMWDEVVRAASEASASVHCQSTNIRQTFPGDQKYFKKASKVNKLEDNRRGEKEAQKLAIYRCPKELTGPSRRHAAASRNLTFNYARLVLGRNLYLPHNHILYRPTAVMYNSSPARSQPASVTS